MEFSKLSQYSIQCRDTSEITLERYTTINYSFYSYINSISKNRLYYIRSRPKYSSYHLIKVLFNKELNKLKVYKLSNMVRDIYYHKLSSYSRLLKRKSKVGGY